MRIWFVLTGLLCACGNVQAAAEHGSSGGAHAVGGGALGLASGGSGGARAVVLAPASETLRVCDTPELEISGAANRDDWQSDRLLFPTSWQTFRGYAMRGPIDVLTGIWSTGVGSAPFQDREIRPLSSALIASQGQLLCAAGTRRALRNGVHALLELDGLGPLTCSGDVVSGELRYCHACVHGDYAISGDLDGEAVLEVTGSHSRVGDTLYLQVGWGVLIAQFAPDAGGEKLRRGAYLSFSDKVYCFDSASGDAREVATADITFTGFRRADPCQADSSHPFARACLEQFEPGREW